MLHPDDRFMRLALDACRRGVEAGQSPFGACIVSPGGEVLAAAHNRVWLEHDPTAHAEVTAIREACLASRNTHPPGAGAGAGAGSTEGATIYSTTEPCPMCFTAIHWARIERIVYGASIADAASFGFNELPISNATMKAEGGSSVELISGFMRGEAVALFEAWRQGGGKAY